VLARVRSRLGNVHFHVSVASVLDPSIITDVREMYVDAEIDHGIDYGNTLAWDPLEHQPLGVARAWIQFDLDLERFYELYVELMTRQASKQ